MKLYVNCGVNNYRGSELGGGGGGSTCRLSVKIQLLCR